MELGKVSVAGLESVNSERAKRAAARRQVARLDEAREEVVKFGAALNFRGFLHAPSNEMGVVSLFGAMAMDLGFMIEAFRQRYPDCEAKQLVDPATGMWEKCRIEFEFRSGNFLRHRHDPAKCDLIVCWEHNCKGLGPD